MDYNDYILWESNVAMEMTHLQLIHIETMDSIMDFHVKYDEI